MRAPPARLDLIREEIDRLDGEILELLAQRRALSVAAGRVKQRQQLPLRDPHREAQLIEDRIRRGTACALDPGFVSRMFSEILRDALRQQESTAQAASSDRQEVPSLTEAVDLPDGYRLASRALRPADTVIEVGDVQIGGPRLVVIAGPCAVESHDQLMRCAREAKAQGADILRGGCFKPRTSPYSFQGLGYEGLEMLAEAGRAFALPIVTEVLAPEHVDPVAEQADILQVGSRNMQNFPLLRAVGASHRPVMLKRGMGASIDEFLQAAEYILAAGNDRVFLCERGIRTFETSTRNTLDISAVPVLQRLTHLPVIVDPSHAAGDCRLVPPLAVAAGAVGAHGVMVEIHPDPDRALSDGPQALDFGQFAEMMTRLRPGA